ncbi:hypothetical protein MMC10_005704 [Thelotrema lepadinum]|nr:hypothetical protein [Thelotrema lepadinum]
MSPTLRSLNSILHSQTNDSAPDNPTSEEILHDGQLDVRASNAQASHSPKELSTMEETEVEGRPPYLHAMLAGGIGGTSGDMLMHSLDTVKTRQQGDPHIPPKYTTMSTTYSTIFRQEGIPRGLYGGVTPALLGSFPGTVIFFGTYEWSKRYMLDRGVAPSISYLTAGFIADLGASVVYVPSEVLKTRLQLQGRYKNPYFNSGYNYRSTWDAAKTIVRTEGLPALFYGYRATLWRDLPFSALQFAFYEKERHWAMRWVGSRDIGLGLEIATAMTAGAMAGTLTCPLDVVKTRLQTQKNPSTDPAASLQTAKATTQPSVGDRATPRESLPKSLHGNSVHQVQRNISTSSPSAARPKAGSITLETSSMITGLQVIYKTEGIAGWFRGVGPRAVWTGFQTGVMFVCYQALLRKLEQWNFGGVGDEATVI